VEGARALDERGSAGKVESRLHAEAGEWAGRADVGHGMGVGHMDWIGVGRRYSMKVWWSMEAGMVCGTSVEVYWRGRVIDWAGVLWDGGSALAHGWGDVGRGSDGMVW